MTDPLKIALDRFDVPPMSSGLAERIARAAAPSTAVTAASRRDRRGMWRRGRQVVLGTLAVGLLSAGAVASGLLGRVGIEVPVLTAMLAPTPKPTAMPVHHASRPVAPRKASVAVPPVAEPAPLAAPLPLSPAERMALRQERRERREAFAAEHPVAAAIIRERVREQLQRRALARRQALMGPAIDPTLPGARTLDFADRAALARAARRDRLAAERMIDRRIRAREARLAADPVSAPVPSARSGGAVLPPALSYAAQRPQLTPEWRAERRERLRQMSPETRQNFRAQLLERRARRLERQGRMPVN